jgi:hypothetical protein
VPSSCQKDSILIPHPRPSITFPKPPSSTIHPVHKCKCIKQNTEVIMAVLQLSLVDTKFISASVEVDMYNTHWWDGHC